MQSLINIYARSKYFGYYCTMKNKAIILLLSISVFMSCSKDTTNSEPVNSIEFITTMIITFVPEGAGETVVFSSYDSDGWNGLNSYGDGPNTFPFEANTVYNASIELLNENESPPLDITPEIIAEGVDHQFVFSDSEATITYEYLAPYDANNRPIGVNFRVTTANEGCSQLLIKLLHQPPKDQPGAETGNYSDLTDVLVDDLDVYPSGCF